MIDFRSREILTITSRTCMFGDYRLESRSPVYIGDVLRRVVGRVLMCVYITHHVVCTSLGTSTCAQHTFLSLFVGSEILGNFLEISLLDHTPFSLISCPHIYISSSYLTPRKLSYMFERDANNKWHSCVELSNRRPNRPD